MLCLREALAASWDKRTAYLEVEGGESRLGPVLPNLQSGAALLPRNGDH
jgi:hypothetical protein